ncbi:MAG TPA: DEAD/DEAH box helicase family protein [Acidimicrobiales bacterium]
MIELLDFQITASDQIVTRVVEYTEEPIQVGRGDSRRTIPFLQLLNSITASGKTLILADAVSSIAKHTVPKPVILWLSTRSVVVAQTFANLEPGGAYHDLLEDFAVRALADFDLTELTTASDSFLFFATVGAFNRSDTSLNVYKSAIDDAARSTWESLKLRPDEQGFRRPLIVVYDEAHNLSDQQTQKLLELEPDAFILATATQRLPRKLDTEVITHLKGIGGFEDDDLTTLVNAKRVAKSGLVKNELILVGEQTSMELTVNELHKAYRQTVKDAAAQGLDQTPKVVYVCKTNIVEATGETDNPRQPFLHRQAPPILIWRHLTESLHLPGAKIAVYCNLTVDRRNPLPDDFILFRGGDSDYERFMAGDFEHIIFNIKLQEGWDDPHVYFAYIDKSMGSSVQAEQVIGRLLRQPGRRHYSAQRLNTAQIFVRVDTVGVFDEVVTSVDDKIRTGDVDIKLTVSRPGSRAKQEIEPKGNYRVPIAAVIADRAVPAIGKCIGAMADWSDDSGTNVTGRGRRAKVQRIVGDVKGAVFAWETYGQTAKVSARWMFCRFVKQINGNALGLVLTSGVAGESRKFDALVGFNSPAATHIADVAEKVCAIYVGQTYLKLRGPDPYEVGPILVDPNSSLSFDNAIHTRYSRDSFNTFERRFAEALDSKHLTWCRNFPHSGYGIPLIEPGRTHDFYPDFLVWRGKSIYAIDTKGSHLHADAARKLVNIRPATSASARVFVRFVSDGVVNEQGAQPNSSGFTVWSFKPNGAREFTHCDDLAASIRKCLQPDV